MPEVLQRGDVYNRRGRTVDFSVTDQLLHGDFPGGLKDLNTTRCDVKQAMVESYARFFLEYEAAPVLMVNAAEIDPVGNDSDYAGLLAEIARGRKGRHYFNPLKSLL